MFKFVSKGDSHENESALFYNGQRILSIYANVYGDDVSIIVDDGADVTQAEWSDYLENYEANTN